MSLGGRPELALQHLLWSHVLGRSTRVSASAPALVPCPWAVDRSRHFSADPNPMQSCPLGSISCEPACRSAACP
ncbi:ubiquinone/menaquinone biosynthesis methyltransferase UbiE domain protein [Burkholderia pseudomallei TSV32]|nr:ubiquinone/menaquinone biosynthesis methyltransferase UbiE domain protein [Burkholderia pseudomallei TSV32]